MKKDKEWLREEIKVDLGNLNWKGKLADIDASNLRGRVNHLIDQLEEPETLNEEWINEHSKCYTMENSVEISDLKNLLLPQPKKPVIPQFVADWIERKKQPDWDYENKEDALADSIHFTLYSLKANYREANPDVVLRKPINEWLNDDRKNYWKLIDGVRYGYEVEKEKKYYVLDYEDIPLLERANNQACKTTTALSIYEDGRDNSRFALTEKEIKDYDKRFWQFAVPVEEEAE